MILIKNLKIFPFSLLLKKGLKCFNVPDIKYAFPSYEDILLEEIAILDLLQRGQPMIFVPKLENSSLHFSSKYALK